MDEEKAVLELRQKVGEFLDTLRPIPDARQVIAALGFQIGHILGQGLGSDAEGAFLIGFNDLMERITVGKLAN